MLLTDAGDNCVDAGPGGGTGCVDSGLGDFADPVASPLKNPTACIISLHTSFHPVTVQ